MSRWLPAGAMIALIALAGGCGGAERSEVRTNSGFILDCPSDTVLYFGITPTVEGGAATPDDALARVTGDPLPPGAPEVEFGTPGQVVYVFTDSEGHRLGRVIIGQPFDTRWSALQAERCG